MKKTAGVHDLHGREALSWVGKLPPVPSFVQFYIMPYFGRPQTTVCARFPPPGLPTALWFLWPLAATCWSRFLPPVQPLSPL